MPVSTYPLPKLLIHMFLKVAESYLLRGTIPLVSLLINRGKMNANPQKHWAPTVYMIYSGTFFISLALLLAGLPVSAQSSTSQARMSQMLNQFEQGKRPTYSTGSGYARGSSSGMPGYANMMGGRRPSNMGGYAGHGGGSSQMMQLMKAKMARMQSSGGGGNSLMQLMRQRQGGAPNMMPGMGGGPGAGMGAQSGLFAKMMQQDAAFSNTMKRNQMNHGMGMGMPGMMGMRRPGMGMNRPGGMGMGLGSGMGMSSMGMSGMGKPGGMGMSGGAGMMGRMQPKMTAPRAGSPFAPKQTTPAKTNTMSDLEKAMESQYGK